MSHDELFDQEMNAIRYYNESFGSDLLRVANATRATIKDRISVVSLVPARSYPGSFGDTAREFQRVVQKIEFLFCYYFSALLDQAVHSSLRQEHPHFDHFARYPKFCGILGSYHTNIHPALLLLVATLYTSPGGEERASKDLGELAAFIADDYYRFLTEEYPTLSGRLTSVSERHAAALGLFAELSNATAILFQPRSLRPFTEDEPVERLYEQWFVTIASTINEKRREIESGPPGD